MGVPTLSICAILAIAPLLWLPELPSPYTVWVMVAGGIVLAAWQNHRVKYAGITLLFLRGAFWPRRRASGRCSI